jgi:hypothetical protein
MRKVRKVLLAFLACVAPAAAQDTITINGETYVRVTQAPPQPVPEPALPRTNVSAACEGEACLPTGTRTTVRTKVWEERTTVTRTLRDGPSYDVAPSYGFRDCMVPAPPRREFVPCPPYIWRAPPPPPFFARWPMPRPCCGFGVQIGVGSRWYWR